MISRTIGTLQRKPFGRYLTRICSIKLQELGASVTEYRTTHYLLAEAADAQKRPVLLACAGAAMVRALRERKESRIVGA
jgi:hypothetical protein